MIEVVHERKTSASPSAVWKLLADFDRIADWADDVDHSCRLTAQSEGVGTQRRIQTGSTVLLERVVTWEPDLRLAYELIGLPAVVKSVVNVWELAVVGDRTRVSITARVDPGARLPVRLAGRAMARRVGSVNQSLLSDLMVAAESV